MTLNVFRREWPNLGSFSVFLDEFSSEDWCVFSRNLARAAELPCIVANTNTQITNLVGQKVSGSRTDYPNEVWSVIFTRLNATVPDLLVSITAEIDFIKQNCAGFDDLAQRNEVFLHVFNRALLASRPGIVELVIAGLKDLKTAMAAANDPWSISRILQFIADFLCQQLCGRKASMQSDAGTFAKIGLFFPSAYNSEIPVSDKQKMFKYHRFIQDHLFYLINPVQSDKDIFVSAKPISAFQNINLHLPGMRRITVWNVPYTRFMPEDFFSILGSINIPFSRPVFHILTEGFFEKMSSAAAISDAANPEALKLPGNPLEVASGVSVVDSSQHSHSLARLYSLEGQDSFNFFSNLVYNCFRSEQREFIPLSLSIVPLLQSWMEKFKFPFLYSVNRIDASFELLARSPGPFISSYHRTKDSSQVDAVFTFREEERTWTASVECKNRAKGVDAHELYQILTRAKNASSRLVLVFCPFYKFPEKDESFVVNACRDDLINVYSVERGDDSSRFNISQYHPLLPLHEDPSMSVIIFSLAAINNMDPLLLT
jgi:hypothetical protein